MLPSGFMAQDNFNLAAAARQEMIDHGFAPDFPPEAERQLETIRLQPDAGLRDLTSLLWSSIDNDDSRDLDQIEWAERVPGGIRVLVGVADVDSAVAKATPIDSHAARETTTVYAGVHTFPMLPERLSTDLTSLNENQDRAGIVIEMVVAADGSIASNSIYRALLRNRAQLAYSTVGPWLEGTAAPPPKVAASADLQAQLKLQDEAAQALREGRHRLGALTFDRQEAQPVFTAGVVTDITARGHNRAAQLIEDFMIGANEVMARTLRGAGVSSIRRVVKAPERWPRIMELAAQYGEKLPADPRSRSAERFPRAAQSGRCRTLPRYFAGGSEIDGPRRVRSDAPRRPRAGPLRPGGARLHALHRAQSQVRRPGDPAPAEGARGARPQPPYSDGELDSIARNCTLMEDNARKVERAMTKRMAAVALHSRVGQSFSAVVTGVTPKGVFVRVFDPPVEGRLMRGDHGLDVGDRLRVTLLSTDPQRGFIDFGR